MSLTVLNIIIHNYYEELNDDNRLFGQQCSELGDDLLAPFAALRLAAKKVGCNVGTISSITLQDASAIIFIDMPDPRKTLVREMLNSGVPLYLMVFESILVRPIDRDLNFLSRFERIFTYNDSLVDDHHYVKINYSFLLPRAIQFDLAKKTKFCVLIASNKRANSECELYSKRIEVIRWFEKNRPDEFDLFGLGWDQHHFGNQFPFRFLNRFTNLRRALSPHYPSYRGPVVRKAPVFERYKFALCFENVRDVPGYITEKIFDCFFAGCVPIYWGASNISNYIPDSCFIDYTKFDSIEDLYEFLANMDSRSYGLYISNIENFVSGFKSSPFSLDCFVDTVLNTILNREA